LGVFWPPKIAIFYDFRRSERGYWFLKFCKNGLGKPWGTPYPVLGRNGKKWPFFWSEVRAWVLKIEKKGSFLPEVRAWVLFCIFARIFFEGAQFLPIFGQKWLCVKKTNIMYFSWFLEKLNKFAKNQLFYRFLAIFCLKSEIYKKNWHFLKGVLIASYQF